MRHPFETNSGWSGAPWDVCSECGEPESDPVHLRPGETCPDCGNELALHSAEHPCPNKPCRDSRE